VGTFRTPPFRSPFLDLLSLDREIVLGGEITVSDNRGDTIGDQSGGTRASRTNPGGDALTVSTECAVAKQNTKSRWS
jgi:hypothetical protein